MLPPPTTMSTAAPERPLRYVTPDEVLLGKWVARQRYTYPEPGPLSARVTLSMRPCWTNWAWCGKSTTLAGALRSRL